MYATQPVKGSNLTARSDNNAFVRFHVPIDDYAKCFKPVLKVNAYSGVGQSRRKWEDGDGIEEVEYCILSPKYGPDIYAMHNKQMTKFPLKDTVSQVAKVGLDLLVTVLAKVKVWRCNSSSGVSFLLSQPT